MSVTLLPQPRRIAACATAALALLLAACSSTRPATFQREDFTASNTYSRSFDGTEAQTCEAARRALLSQGYVVTIANADLVNARKNFQPEADSHVQTTRNSICTWLSASGWKFLRAFTRSAFAIVTT